MNEWDFYESVFDVTKDFLKYQIVPMVLKKIILEIDEAIRKWKADRENGDIRDFENVNEDYRKIDSRKLRDIYEIFKDRSVERDKYLEVFPEYKKDTKDIITNLNNVTFELRNSLQSYVETPNEFANAAGALAGGLRLLSLTTSLSSSLSLLMNASSVTNGAVRAATTVAEHAINENHLNKAVKLIDEHKTKFTKMSRWFTYDDCLTKSIAAAIGTETTKKIFEKFQKCHKIFDNFVNDNPKAIFALEIIKSLSEILLKADFKLMVAYSVTAALFQIFWLHYGSRWISDWGVAAVPAERLKTLSVSVMYVTHTYLAWRSLRNPLNSFYSNNPLGVTLGIAIDLIPPLLDAKKKKGKSGNSDLVKNIKKVIQKLEDELKLFQEVYNTLKVEKDLSED